MTEYINKEKINPMRCPRSIAEMREWLNEMPTIDIVHCKDCKHRKGKGGVINAINGGVYHWCEKNHKDNDDNWYCADGERKETK